MRGITVLIATILTAGYGFAAQAAMTADRAETVRRIAGLTAPVAAAAPTAEEAATRVWYGGMLAPLIVEAEAPCPAPRAVET